MSYYTGTSSGIPSIAKKRKVYFAFHYDDIMRVNNVRNAWKIDHPNSSLNRSFYDSSLWESKKAQGDLAVKNLIRQGVGYTSAVCVLIGVNTYLRRWVRYEIARSIVDKRGLLAVHINRLRHHKTLLPSPLGPNPLEYMGLARKPDGKVYLCELVGATWRWYKDYTLEVPIPAYAGAIVGTGVRSLASSTREYDYVMNSGATQIGAWIDNAAQQVGR